MFIVQLSCFRCRPCYDKACDFGRGRAKAFALQQRQCAGTTWGLYPAVHRLERTLTFPHAIGLDVLYASGETDCSLTPRGGLLSCLCLCNICIMPRILEWDELLQGLARFKILHCLKSPSDCGGRAGGTFWPQCAGSLEDLVLSAHLPPPCPVFHRPPSTGRQRAPHRVRFGRGTMEFNHCNVVDFNSTCKLVKLYFWEWYNCF